MTLTTPLFGMIFLGRLGLAKANLQTKFEVSNCTHYEHMKNGAKCRNWGGLVQLRVTDGNVTIWQNAYDFLFKFNRNYVSALYCFRDIASHLSKVANF